MYQPKRENLRKDSVIALRVSEREFDTIKHKATETGISLSSWCREIILDYLRMQQNEIRADGGEK